MATPAAFSEKSFFGDAIVGVVPENWIDARYAVYNRDNLIINDISPPFFGFDCVPLYDKSLSFKSDILCIYTNLD